MLDFNTAGHQTEGNGGAIPPDSIVAFKMTIRSPRAGKEGSVHPLFNRASTGNEYIDVEFEVVGGAYAGKKMWQNYTLSGSEKAAQISMRTLRAIIESARNINPNDASPQASAARQLSDWADFNSMQFLGRVKCTVDLNNKDGRYYVNNELAKVITPDMPEYQHGESISDKSLPVLPADPGQMAPAAGSPALGANAAAPAAAPAGAPAWGAPAGHPASASAPVPAQAPAVAPAAAGMPDWAKR